ncbi:hypothetical protein IQ07DRAFT_132407 [Pyrenochaeta sp. DS3sAY3a]|nr:hypothetical protein IQ07DRAFT_132407 [Pyrenochaeta sp. DS3sAY3a]
MSSSTETRPHLWPGHSALHCPAQSDRCEHPRPPLVRQFLLLQLPVPKPSAPLWSSGVPRRSEPSASTTLCGLRLEAVSHCCRASLHCALLIVISTRWPWAEARKPFPHTHLGPVFTPQTRPEQRHSISSLQTQSEHRNSRAYILDPSSFRLLHPAPSLTLALARPRLPASSDCIS